MRLQSDRPAKRTFAALAMKRCPVAHLVFSCESGRLARARSVMHEVTAHMRRHEVLGLMIVAALVDVMNVKAHVVLGPEGSGIPRRMHIVLAEEARPWAGASRCEEHVMILDAAG